MTRSLTGTGSATLTPAAHRLHRCGVCVVPALAALLMLLACAAADPFLAGSEDIPLMPGLVQGQDAGLQFDAPGGRIVESFAVGAVVRSAVLQFYDQTLPALGWRRLAVGRYGREGEVLMLDFFGADGGLTVRFTLAPG